MTKKNIDIFFLVPLALSKIIIIIIIGFYSISYYFSVNNIILVPFMFTKNIKILVAFSILIIQCLQFTFSNSIEPFNQPNVGYFWQVSDPHIDIHYKIGADPRQCNFETVCCRHFFENQTSRAGPFGSSVGYCDTPMSTILAGFQFIHDYSQRMSNRPEFILLAGDNAAHDNELPSQSEDLNLEKVKMISQIAHNISHTLGMKVFPTIGNHDSYPVDNLRLPPNRYLEILSKIWSIHGLSEKSLLNVQRGGFYSEKISPGLKLITYNCQWMNNINFWLYVDGNEDHAKQIQWLEEEFEDSNRDNEKIFILGHIGPFDDRWNMLSSKPDWKFQRYMTLLKKYEHLVIGQFHGHNHIDSFRVYVGQQNPEKAIASSFIGGIMTPWTYRNPTIRLYKYDKEKKVLLDYTDFVGDVEKANERGGGGGNIIFEKSYSFSEEYSEAIREVHMLTPQVLLRLVGLLKDNDTLWNRYWKNYSGKYRNSGRCEGDCKRNHLSSLIISRL